MLRAVCAKKNLVIPPLKVVRQCFCGWRGEVKIKGQVHKIHGHCVHLKLEVDLEGINKKESKNKKKRGNNA